MNTKFLVNGRWYKTPCSTVLQSEEFSVKFFTGNHFILAHVVNKIIPTKESKMYFEKIDDVTLSSIKCDFHFNNRYNHPKEFLSNLYDTLDSFLNTSLPDKEKLLKEKCPVYKSTDEVLDRILEIVTTEAETAETENSPEINNEYDETKELLTVYQFERLTKTLFKSLFKAIGLEETRKIPFIISNNMVFFNYNGIQYKYYPSQCKVFKKCGRKYQRINWKDFAEENNPDGQKQFRGRSPPFTPDIRSINIDKFKIKE